MSALEFDAEAHIYRLNGEKIPSVTQIIGAVIERKFNPGDWYLQRGRAIHHAIHLLASNQLDWDTVDERIKPRLDALQAFLAENNLWPDDSEIQLASERMRFAGTIDAFLINETGSIRILGDWKSSLEPHVELQLGAYSLLRQEQHYLPSPTMLCAIELKETGRYNCRWFKGLEIKRAENNFKAVLSTYNWMRTHNLLPKEKQ